MRSPVCLTDLVGTVWDFWGSSGSFSFGKSLGRSWYPSLSFVPPVNNDGIIGFQQENSYYSQCSIYPPSSTTISSYWVTPQHTNKTLSSDHGAPTYTPNPPMHSVTGTPHLHPPLLAELPHPPLTASIKTHPFSPVPFSMLCKSSLEAHRLNNISNYRGDCFGWITYCIWCIAASKLPFWRLQTLQFSLLMTAFAHRGQLHVIKGKRTPPTTKFYSLLEKSPHCCQKHVAIKAVNGEIFKQKGAHILSCARGNVWSNTSELTLVVWMNPGSVHSKLDEDGNIVTKAHPLHHMQREEIWARPFFGRGIETAAELCRAPLSGTDQRCLTLTHTCGDTARHTGFNVDIWP